MAQAWPSERVRATFVDFFVGRCGHAHVPSSPVFPYDDPTLLFTNAGMNQFKPIFLGTVDPKSEQAKLTRAANSQKCIRAGGKHNDLEDVGKDTYHHTFFEMLGNWSFGDYFQQEAISWAWELLTSVYGLDPNRIYATYFKGDEADGLPADTKAKEIWETFLPPERVLPFGRKENFWEMGETGPCGPCSEIHYDRVGGRDASQWVNADSPEVIEIWNLVFMAFNREESGKLTPLPSKHVDTGMGFERLTSILQDVKSNYDSDVFTPIFEAIHELTKAPKYSGRLGKEDTDNRDTAYRIVADHIRTLSVALADGAQPSAGGRGYVLRRILRRAVRAGKSFLNAPDGFFHQLVQVVVDKLGSVFPELVANKDHVVAVIKHEEALFIRTLDRGLRRFEALTRNLKKGDSLTGSDAFLLYGTYGFPLDLIQVMCEERGLNVDLKSFNEKLLRTREDSQKAYAVKKGEVKFALSADAISQLQKKGIPETDDRSKYELQDIEAKVVAIWQGTPENGSFVDTVPAGEECGVVLDKTNFYAEGGGQIYDCGFLTSDTLRFDVNDTQAFGGFVVHVGSVGTGAVKLGETVTCTVNNERRSPIMANHTATHMVNLALRTLVNPKTEQRGSVVSDDRFRFDFDNSSALGREQLQAVEDHVNEIIKKQLPVYTKEIALEEAKLIRGVKAMFGESYPNPVRVVSVGADLEQDKDNEKWGTFSIEFCGGTHLGNSSEAQLFTIVSEEPVSMGVRRLVVVTGDAARTAYSEADRLAKAVAALENVSDDRLPPAVSGVQASIDAAVLPAWRKIDLRALLLPFQEKVKKLQKDKVAQDKASGSEQLTKAVEELKASNASFYVASVSVGSNNRILSDSIVELVNAAKKELDRDVAVMLFSSDAKKAIVAANVPASLITKGLKANEWVADAAKVLGGKGGGSPKGDVAQGNGADIAKVPDAVEAAKSFAQAKLA